LGKIRIQLIEWCFVFLDFYDNSENQVSENSIFKLNAHSIDCNYILGAMTIIVGSQPISQLPETVAEIYKSFPFLETEALKLVQAPLHIIDKPEGVLYITQKEYVV
jgi:hypothetical protein